MTRLRAYTVAEAARVLGMASAEVHKAIEHGLLWAFTADKATQVPREGSRARAGKRRPPPASRKRKPTSRCPSLAAATENEGPREWTFERQAPRSSARN